MRDVGNRRTVKTGLHHVTSAADVTGRALIPHDSRPERGDARTGTSGARRVPTLGDRKETPP